MLKYMTVYQKHLTKIREYLLIQNNDPKYRIPLTLTYNRTLTKHERSSKETLEHIANKQRI